MPPSGGIFYAFSTFVMKGLASHRQPRPAAITAMRGITRKLPRTRSFLAMFLGSALLALAVGIVAVTPADGPASRAAGTCWPARSSVLGGVIVTMAFNVPLNNHLDGVDPAGLSAADAASQRGAYLSTWTAWNHVRTATALVGAALMLIGLRDR